MGPGSMLRRARIALASWMILVGACGGPGEASAPQPPPSPPCQPKGVPRNPTSIAEAVALVSALPRPLTVGCYLESLERPLRVNATSAVISLQPAAGPRNPRMFLFAGNLVSSIVPAGS